MSLFVQAWGGELSLVLLACLLGTAAYTDIRRRQIANQLCLAVLLLGFFQLYWGFTQSLSLLGVLLLLVLSAGLYAAGIFAGGDIKLAVALCVYFGGGLCWYFLFLVLIAGGVWALLYALWQRYSPMQQALPGMPYGVAIVVAALGLAIYRQWYWLTN